jgi:uncharacterized repeat protein (TIGR01451 family)
MPYRVSVRNVGDGAAKNVVLNLSFPDGLTTLDGRTTVTFDVGVLAPGQAKEATFSAKPHTPGTYSAHATVSADGGLFAETDCHSEVVVPVLNVTKTGPATRYIGRPATYEITVSNQGNADARDTRLIDTLPTGVELSSVSDGGTRSGQEVTWQVGTLAPGSSKSVSLTVVSAVPGTIQNKVVAKAYCAEACDSIETVVKGIPAILLEVIDIDDPIEVGANSAYRIIVTNQGSAYGTNIAVTCTLPSEQEYVSAGGPTAASVAGQTVTFAPLPSLPPKARVSYRVDVKGVAPGDVRFRTSLRSDQAQVPIEETESTHIY